MFVSSVLLRDIHVFFKYVLVPSHSVRKVMIYLFINSFFWAENFQYNRI